MGKKGVLVFHLLFTAEAERGKLQLVRLGYPGEGFRVVARKGVHLVTLLQKHFYPFIDLKGNAVDITQFSAYYRHPEGIGNLLCHIILSCL
jgi:hypothetical protein